MPNILKHFALPLLLLAAGAVAFAVAQEEYCTSCCQQPCQSDNESVEAKIKDLLQQIAQCLDEGHNEDALVLAEQAIGLAPDHVAVQLAYTSARQLVKIRRFEALRAEKKPDIIPATYNSNRPEAELEILRKLDTMVVVDIEKPISLGDLFAYLQTLTGITIVPDSNALREAGISMDQTVQVRFPTMIPLKRALKLILGNVGLDYVVKDEVIMITTPKRAKGPMRRIIYYVGDLIQETPSSQPSEADWDKIINLITTVTGGQDEWDDPSTKPMPYYPNLSLVIKQTEGVHQQIVDLLIWVREFTDKQSVVEVPSEKENAASTDAFQVIQVIQVTNRPVEGIFTIISQLQGESEVLATAGMGIAVDSHTNSLVVVASSPEIVQTIKELVQKLDKPAWATANTVNTVNR